MLEEVGAVDVVAVAQEDVETEPLVDPKSAEKRSVQIVYQGSSVQPMRSA